MKSAAANDFSLQTKCAHCGSYIEVTGEKTNELHFCCDGCKTAYSILNHPKAESYHGAYQNFICYEDSNITVAEFVLPGIHCTSCVYSLENLHQIEPRIKSVRIDFLKKKARIVFYNNQFEVKDLIQCLKNMGYEPDLTIDDQQNQEKSKQNHTFLIKLGVSGFAAGNIMLFSLPEYFGITGDFSNSFKNVFTMLNLFLSIPVVFFCADEYFKSAYAALKQRKFNFDVPTCLGFVSLLSLSYYEILTQQGPGYLDSFSALVFFLLLARYFQNKTFDAIRFDKNYTTYFPFYAEKQVGTEILTIPVSELKPGDIIQLKNNSIVPADGILLSTDGLVNYAFITGESRLASVNEGDEIKAGAKWEGTTGKMCVTKKFAESKIVELWQNDAFAFDKTKHVQTLADNRGKMFTILMLSLATLSTTYWLYTSTVGQAMYIFVCVLITACPCVLALSGPIVYGVIARHFAKHKLYLKNALFVENLARCTDVVFDKTGTLTDMHTFDIVFYGQALTQSEKTYLKSVLNTSNHPLSKAIDKHLQAEILFAQNVNEQIGKGIEATVANKNVKVGSKVFVTGSASSTNTTKPGSEVWVSIDGRILGYFLVNARFKDNLKMVVQNLKNHKINLHVLSGDNDSQRNDVKEIFGDSSSLVFMQNPIQKLQYISSLQSTNKEASVVMIGDGINDAGALQKSNVGISISSSEQSFFPACDALLQEQSFGMLHKFVMLARKSHYTINLCFAISILYNIVGISLASSGSLTPLAAAILMPLNSMSVALVGWAVSSYWSKKILKDKA